MFGKAAKSGVGTGVGWGSPMLFNKFPCKRLSSAFCTVGSLRSGDGETPVPADDVELEMLAGAAGNNTMFPSTQ